jgi:hypothetical protein
MKFLDGPSGGPPRTLYSQPKPGIDRIEYSVFTNADCNVAWKVFADWRYWHKLSDIYGSMEWRGAPWEAGSRLQIQIVKPVATVVDQVITVCAPPRCVAWIDHVMGYTMEHWVLFDPSYVTGEPSSLEWQHLREFLESFIEQWYGNFAAECDRLAAAT